MKSTISIIIFSLVLFTACSSQPQPFVIGKDDCTVCKMGVVDLKYGGEIITKKGKYYKFDDLRCMITFIKSTTLEEKDIARTLTINFNKPNEFVDVNNAWFAVSPDLRSPMGSNAAGVTTKEAAEKLKGSTGQLLSWNDLLKGVNK
ncbi:MAG: nitrous oxide reductase accessory protein NosL [Chitinophagaceae bacterium]